MNNAAKYTQEQMDIAVLKNTNEGILRSISDLRDDMKTELSAIRAEMKSQGHMNLGLSLGIYGMIGAAALAKIFGVM